MCPCVPLPQCMLRIDGWLRTAAPSKPVGPYGDSLLQPRIAPGRQFASAPILFALAHTQTAGYSGLLIAAPTVLYEIAAYIVPGLTKSERQFLAPVVAGSSVLFYLGCVSEAAPTLMLHQPAACVQHLNVPRGRSCALQTTASWLQGCQPSCRPASFQPVCAVGWPGIRRKLLCSCGHAQG